MPTKTLIALAVGILVLILLPPAIFPHLGFKDAVVQRRDAVSASGPMEGGNALSPLADPKRIAAAFGYRESLPSVSAPAPSIAPSPVPAAKNDSLRIVGTVEDTNGVKYIFIKDLQRNYVYKVREDGKEEDNVRLISRDSRTLTVQIDSAYYTVRRN